MKQKRTNRSARRKDAAQTKAARKHNAAVRAHEKPPETKRRGFLGWLRSLFEAR